VKVVKAGNQNQAIKQAAIKKAITVLKKGGLVIYPTETCYGIGGDATNLKAVKKVLQFKGSRGNKPVSIAVADKKMAEKYVIINSVADNLYKEFLPGPLTVVSKSKQKTIGLLEAGQRTLGIRIPDYNLVIKIVKGFGRPITSTSANTSGKKTPYCLNDVLKYTSQKRLALVDLFLDAGRLFFHLPSTVVNTTLNESGILRRGEIKIAKTKSNSFVSNSEAETKKIARDIFEKHKKVLAKKSLIFALQGELGSGKTQFAKGLGLSLGIKNNITSPTFTIIKEYPYSVGIFYHLDTWRLEKGEELLSLGLKEMMLPQNVIVIEWMQKIRPILKQIQFKKKTQIIWVTIESLSENQRRITYQS